VDSKGRVDTRLAEEKKRLEEEEEADLGGAGLTPMA